jgi:hypothetical protein
MNLHAIVSGAVGAINPQVFCTLRMSAGYAVGPDGTQTPAYTIVPNVPAQIQALTFTDLMKLGGLNIEGTRRAIYLSGNIEGVDRAALKGGDLFTFPDGTVWLVVQVLEHWPDWTKCAVTLQNGS